MEEIWKDIKGFEGKYQESNLDRVRSLKTNKLLKRFGNKYYLVNGRKNRIVFYTEAYLVKNYNGSNGELWEDIECTNGMYQVSNYGRVRSVLHKKILQTNGMESGTYRIMIEGREVSFNANSDKVVSDLDGEEWLVCKKSNNYMISNLGRVKCIIPTPMSKEHIIGGSADTHGYICVKIDKKYHKVHRLVAECFIDNPNGLPFVNHKDENPSNNRVDNLEWCTHLYNVRYGTAIQRKKEKAIKKPIVQLTLEGQIVKRWESAREAGAATNSIPHCICECAMGYKNKKTHNGYIWKYEEDYLNSINS